MHGGRLAIRLYIHHGVVARRRMSPWTKGPAQMLFVLRTDLVDNLHWSIMSGWAGPDERVRCVVDIPRELHSHMILSVYFPGRLPSVKHTHLSLDRKSPRDVFSDNQRWTVYSTELFSIS